MNPQAYLFFLSRLYNYFCRVYYWKVIIFVLTPRSSIIKVLLCTQWGPIYLARCESFNFLRGPHKLSQDLDDIFYLIWPIDIYSLWPRIIKRFLFPILCTLTKKNTKVHFWRHMKCDPKNEFFFNSLCMKEMKIEYYFFLNRPNNAVTSQRHDDFTKFTFCYCFV